MLEELHVHNLALIEEVRLEFSDRFTVLTGETGAGKTALVGAVKLLVGERADSTMVAAGADEAVVEGRIAVGDDEIVVRRRLGSDGRSRCALNGEMSTVGALGSTVGPLFDLHGQHEHQALLHPAKHVRYLDRYVGAAAQVASDDYAGAFERHAAVVLEFAELENRIAEDRRRSDYLRFVVTEIESVAPACGEDEALEARLPGLRHGERLTAASSEAHGLLCDTSTASEAMSGASRALARVRDVDPQLDALAERLSETIVQIEDVTTSLRDYGESIEHDSAALNSVEARLSALGELKKKYGPTLTDVVAALGDAKERLAAVDDGERELEAASEQVGKVAGRLRDAGARLAGIRHDAAPAFVAALEDETADLAMGGASFEVSFEDLDFENWTVAGPHRAEFLYAAAPDQPFRALSKIASGGEVSRVMLALKTVLGAADDVPVLVFDEIDAGIGGATANAVGAKLSQLSRTHQILVITHLAQVAVFADRHLVVDKSVDEDRVRTAVTAVVGDERVAEVSRMLSGADTPAGRVHAEELLSAAAVRYEGSRV